MYLPILRVHFKTISAKDLSNVLMRCFFVVFFFVFFFPDFLYKNICCGHIFELHRLIDAV